MAENSSKSRDAEINLRPIQLSDIDDFMVWASDVRVTQFCTWDPYTSRAEALRFFTNNAMPHPWYRAICAGGRAVGSISATPGSGSRSSTAELGYVLAFDHWGKGIATEAVKMVASTIFQELPLLEKLEAFVDVDNVRSQRVLEKAGFVKEDLMEKRVIKGKSRDTVVFSLLSSQQNNT